MFGVNIEELAVRYWWVLAGSVVLVLIGAAAVPFVLIRLPADYFVYEKGKTLLNRLPFPVLYLLLVLKNIAGIILLLFGIVLLFVPGQGILTIIAGVVLMNFPGKRRLMRYVVRKKPVYNGINWIRAKAGKEKILI